MSREDELREGDELLLDDPYSVYIRYTFIETKDIANRIFLWGAEIRTPAWIFDIQRMPDDVFNRLKDHFDYQPWLLCRLFDCKASIKWEKNCAQWFPYEQTPKKEQDVYFLQAGTDGPIKIGIASCTAKRIAQLQCGCPWPIRVLGRIPRGGIALESKLHRQFSAYNTSGEWFSPCKALIQYIEKNALDSQRSARS